MSPYSFHPDLVDLPLGAGQNFGSGKFDAQFSIA